MILNNIQINKTITENQIDTIVKLGEEIWTEHYSPIIGINQVNYMLNKFQSKKAIQTQINQGYIYFNILLNKENVGYFSIQPRTDSLFLSKIYIHKKQRGKKIFSTSLNFIEKKAKEIGLSRIELTVNKYNKNSITIYLSKGFKILRSEIFDIENGYVMDDYVLSKDLL